MSQTIDKRVVEMRFDNKQFEDGVKESLGTLDKLKNVLDKGITSKSLDGLKKSASTMDISGISKGIESLQDRFSTLGIVGMRVIENITDGLMGGIGKAVTSVTDSIVSGGVKRAMNIENAHFQLQGLISDETEVQAIMSDAMDSVDGTAYAYDEAAKAASMFAASGLTSGDKMQKSLKAIAGTAATTNSNYSDMANIFTKVAGQGKVMTDELNQFAARGMNAAAAVTKFMNGVSDGSIEASDSVTKYVKELTKGTQITEGELREMVTKSKISFELFTEAMATTFGDHAKDANQTFTGAMANIRAALARTGAMFVSPLVKQNGPFVEFFNAIRIKVNEFNKALGASNGMAKKFTDWINTIVSKMTKFVEGFKLANTYVHKWGDGTEQVIESAHKSIQKWGDGTEKVVNRDLYTPFHAFQDIIYTIVNLLKGIGSVIKPIGKAFADVFAFKDGGVGLYKTIERIRQFSEGLKLSEKNSENLRKAFTGLFSIIKSVLSVIGKFIQALIPGRVTTGSFVDTLLSLSGALGDGLVHISEWIDQSTLLQSAFEAINKASTFMANTLGEAFSFIEQKISGFDAAAALDNLATRLTEVGNAIYDMIPQWAKDALNDFEQTFISLGNHIMNLNLSGIQEDLNSLKETLEGFLGFKFSDVKASIDAFFDFSNEESGINRFRATVEGFVEWFKTTVIPIFDSISLGGLLAGGGGFYLLIQVGNVLGGLAKMFRGAGKVLESVPDLLKQIKNTIKAYQNELNANTILKVSIAIGVLAGAIFALAQIDDTDKLVVAAAAIGIVGLTLLTALLVIEKLPKKMVTVADALQTAATKFAKALSKALTIRAIGSAVRDIALAIGIVIASIAGIMYLWNKDEAGFKRSITIIGVIAAALLLIIATMSLLGSKLSTGMKAFGSAALGTLALAAALLVIVKALKDVMAMQLPMDYETKLRIFENIFIGLGALALVMGASNRLAGKAGLSIGKGGLNSTGGMKASPILAMCTLLYTTVAALAKLMEMKLPKDYERKLRIFENIFIGLGALILVMGAASRLAKGNMKATGSILAMCTFIGVAIGAIYVLGSFPAAKLHRGMEALGQILLGLAIALVGAGKVASGGAWKAILAMVFLIPVIVASLGVLSMIKGENLLKAAGALSSILMMIAIDFVTIGKISNGNSYKSVLSMVAMVAVIAGSLLFLSSTNWVNLLSSAVAMSSVLFVLSDIFKKISSSKSDPKRMLAKVGTFLLLGVALAEIAIPLAMLATFNWARMLTAAVSITAVLLAYTKAFEVIGKTKNISVEKIGMFLLGALATWVIAVPIGMLASLNWKGMLAGAASISAVLLAIGGAFAIMNSVPSLNGMAIGNMVIGCLGAIAIGFALTLAAKYPWKNLLAAGGAIAAVMVSIGAAFAIMNLTPPLNPLSIANMLIGCAGTIAIGFALSLAAKYPWKGLLAAGGAISAVLISMSIAFGILSAVGTNLIGMVGALPAFILGCIGVVAIGAVVSKAAQQPWENLLAAGVSISAVILAMSVAMLLCSAAGLIAPAAIAGMALLDIFVANLTAVLMALGYIRNKVPNFDQLIEGGSGVLGMIGKAIGNFVGSIVEGIGEAIGRTLEKIGTSLTNFMSNAQGFFDGLSKFNDKLLDGALTMVAIILALAAAEFLNGISNMFKVFTGEGDPDTLGPKLESFGRSIMGFYNETKGIKDAEQFNLVAQGALYLIEMCKKIPNSGGFLGKVFGDNDADIWGQQVAILGKHLVALSNTIKGADFSGFEPFANATLILIDMAKQIPNSGGGLGALFGENDADIFGKQVYTLGIYMAHLADTIAPCDFSKIDPFAAAVQVLINMASGIQNTGGVAAFFAGDNDFGTFGKTLEDFSKHFIVFYNNIADIEVGKVTAIAPAIRQLIDVVKTMSEVDGSSARDFAKNLEEMSKKGLKGFIDEFSTQTPKAVAAINNFIKSINAAITGNGSDTFQQAFKKFVDNGVRAYRQAFSDNQAQAVSTINQFVQKIIQALQKFDSQFKQRGVSHANQYLTGIKSLYAQAQTTGQALGNRVLAGLQSLYNSFTNAGKTSASNYISGISSKNSEASSAGSSLAGKAVEGMGTKNSDANSKGSTVGQNFVDGIESKNSAAAEKGDALADAAIGAMDSESNVKAAKKAGSNIAQGFIDGMDSRMKDVQKKAEQLAKAAIDAANKKLDSHSPSREFRKIGGTVGSGFVLGISDWLSRVKDVSSDLAESSMSGMSTVLDSINDTFTDIDPTITPVVDLSNVMAASDLINQMFSSALISADDITTKASQSMGLVRQSNANSNNNIQNESDKSGTTVTFNQYNTSPKALSRFDIYRDTRNQLSQLKEVMNGI